MVCDQERDRGGGFFFFFWGGGGGGWGVVDGGWGGYPKEGESSDFWASSETPPIPPFSGTSESPHKENPEEGIWPAYCNCFEKSVVIQYVLVL